MGIYGTITQDKIVSQTCPTAPCQIYLYSICFSCSICSFLVCLVLFSCHSFLHCSCWYWYWFIFSYGNVCFMHFYRFFNALGAPKTHTKKNTKGWKLAIRECQFFLQPLYHWHSKKKCCGTENWVSRTWNMQKLFGTVAFQAVSGRKLKREGTENSRSIYSATDNSQPKTVIHKDKQATQTYHNTSIHSPLSRVRYKEFRGRRSRRSRGNLHIRKTLGEMRNDLKNWLNKLNGWPISFDRLTRHITLSIPLWKDFDSGEGATGRNSPKSLGWDFGARTVKHIVKLWKNLAMPQCNIFWGLLGATVATAPWFESTEIWYVSVEITLLYWVLNEFKESCETF